MNAVELLFDSNRGVFIPQNFAQDCLGHPSNPEKGWDFPEHHAEALLRGPEGDDSDGYWDAWNAMLDRAVFKDGDDRWVLYQDGDLWAVNWNMMTIAERIMWQDPLGKEDDDLFELTGTADDRDVLESLMGALNVAKENYFIKEHGYHSLWLHIINSHEDILLWRAPTFQEGFQHDVMDNVKFAHKWIHTGATYQAHSGG